MILEDRKRYDGVQAFAEMLRLKENFDFGPALGTATFPDEFAEYYASFSDALVDYDDNRLYFHHPLGGDGIAMFDGLDSPYGIRSQNGIIAESIYAPKGSVILPRGYYVIGSAYSEDEMRLLVNLDRDGPDYGKIYVWYLAHDPLGTGDNTRGVGQVAGSLKDFIEGLVSEEELKS